MYKAWYRKVLSFLGLGDGDDVGDDDGDVFSLVLCISVKSLLTQLLILLPADHRAMIIER